MDGELPQLGKIHHSLTSYNVNACDGEMSFHIGLYTPRNSHPVRLVFEGEAMNSIANSLKRIADAVVAQCNHCYAAFEAFQALVREQEAAISSCNAPANPILS